MSPTSHDSLARGHRVREFVCAYRTLRDDQGQAVRLPTKALSDPRIAAATLAPLLASETVEVFAVACLSTRHQLLAWHVLSRGTRSSTPISLPDVFVPACLTPGTTALLVVHNHPSGDPTEPGRCATHASVGAGGRHPRHAAARSPDRRRRRPLLQLPRSRNTHRKSRTESVHDTTPGHHSAGLSGVPQGRQASSLRSDPVRGWRA